MKNRTIFRILALLAVSAAATVSCIDDKGNYDYLDASEVMPVVIEGLKDMTVVNLTNLKIVPQLNDGDREYAYSWYVTPTSPHGVLPVKTVLSSERNLDITLRLAPESYYMYLEVSDPARNNVSVRKRVILRVMGSEIHKGWYILKDDDGYTDFDYINDQGKLYSDVMSNSGISGEKLEGRAVQIAYQSGWYNHKITLADGRDSIVENLSAYHILSERGLRTIDGATLELLKNYDQQFYVAPEECAPQSLSMPNPDIPDQYLVNNGKIHVIAYIMPNIGKYPAAKSGFYNAHKDIFSTMFMALFFDTVERTFYTVESTGSYFTPATDNYMNPFLPSPYNMDYSLVSMFQTSNNSADAYGYAIMQGLSDGKYYLASVNCDMMLYFGAGWLFNSFDEIPAGCRLPLAEVKAGSPSGSFIYFGDANKLCVYRNAPGLDQQEEAMVTYPAGETVGYIYCRGTEVVVLTNSAAGWKLYGYELVGAGNPELKPAKFTYSGTGTGRHVMYRDQVKIEE